MTDFLTKLWEAAVANLDGYIILIVLCAGFFQAKYFKGFHLVKDESYDAALKTLALSFVVSVIYIMLVRNPDNVYNWSKYFVSYFTATSLYELIIDPFRQWVLKKLSNNTP